MTDISGEIKRLLNNNEIVIFDVGARGGFHKRWDKISDNIFFVGFEPDKDEYEKMSESEGKNVLYINAALDKIGGEQTLYLCRERGCSSLYMPNFDFTKDFSFGWAFKVESQIGLVSKTMDEVCELNSIKPDILKLDVQGAELDILQGGSDALKNVLIIETEVSFQELYLGAPFFADIDIFLRNNGFRLLGLRRSYWRLNPSLGRSEGGHLVHGDALYYRDTFDQLNNVQKIKLMAALLCYQQYDLVSYMSRLFNQPDIAKILPSTSFWIRPFGKLVRGRLHRWLRKGVDKLRYHAKDWHDPDYF